MFTDLKPLLNSCTSVTIVLASGGDDQVNVTIIPKAKDGQNASLSTPLALIATLEELDAEFAQVVLGYSAKRTSLAEQLEATATILDAAKQEAAKSAVAGKGKKPHKPASASSDDFDEDEENGGDEKPESSSAAPEKLAPAAAPVDDLWA